MAMLAVVAGVVRVVVVLVRIVLFVVAGEQAAVLGINLAFEFGHGRQAGTGIVDLLPLVAHEPFEAVVEADVAAFDLGMTQRVSSEDLAWRVLPAEHLGIGALPDDLLLVLGVITEPNGSRLDDAITGGCHGRQGTS